MQPDLRRLLTLVQTSSAAREVYAAAVAMLGVSASVDAQTRPLGIIQRDVVERYDRPDSHRRAIRHDLVSYPEHLSVERHGFKPWDFERCRDSYRGFRASLAGLAACDWVQQHTCLLSVPPSH